MWQSRPLNLASGLAVALLLGALTLADAKAQPTVDTAIPVAGGGSGLEGTGETSEGPFVSSFHLLDESDFLPTLMRSDKPLIAFITSEFCPACPIVERALGTQTELLESAANLYQMEINELSSGFLDRYGVIGVPTFLVFMDKQLADIAIVYEGNREMVTHILARNGLIDEGPETLMDFSQTDPGAFSVDPGGAVMASRLDGWDLSGRSFRGVTFSGCQLRGVNLRGANLNETTFSRTDLTGANLENAELAEVFWLNTTCPDGTFSADHGQTCAGHLSLE